MIAAFCEESGKCQEAVETLSLIDKRRFCGNVVSVEQTIVAILAPFPQYASRASSSLAAACSAIGLVFAQRLKKRDDALDDPGALLLV